ncbi:5-formyltetrahydrofolate cyclo-ligase [Dyadobacter subterraneus]|uniref:5-formyltetrahydrofolate cyclo-ligase n=1 Tax=Dyadobacter subterraneus TaxID=2773304 RepID=A0ABR9WK39_9BACT|nr:5-formyltetrahydrofolate cyclo-ligase [Dyadobacter subterraneus]MBE9465845.1 5-formyltetrahydrofolate cyclo-ligase [Dyadobacter subterraneus]
MEKSILRAEYLKKRMDLTQDEIVAKNNAITENLKLLLAGQEIKTIHIFLPQHGKVEIDTWQIISLLQNSYPPIAIATPRIIPGTKEMEHFLLKPETNLIENRWKIPEADPETSVKIEPQIIDAVLIPLLAFDKKGFRAGYGGGYYDRFLVQCKPDVVKIGLSFFEAEDKIDGLDRFDVAMNYCVTPFGIVQF